MKKLFFIILLALFFVITPLSAQAITTYNCNGLTGGTQRDLDYLSVAILNNGDRAVVLTGTIKYHFKYDSTATNAENVATHPFKVRPDDWSATGVWIEQELATGSVDAAIIATSGVTTTEILDGTIASADLATGTVIPAKVNIPGFVIRPKFTFSAPSDKIYLRAFVYDHQGTTEQLVYSASTIEFQFGSGGSNSDSTNIANDDWYYLYIDDSAVDTAGTNVIAAAQLLAVTEEPVRSEAKNGHYGSAAAGNATAVDRCIAAFRTGGALSILEFSHEGNYMHFADHIADLAAYDIDTTWEDVTLTMPKFARRALITILNTYGDTSSTTYWRKNESGATGHQSATADVANTYPSDTVPVFTDDSQIIEVVQSDAGTNTNAIFTHGWYFPSGM